MEEGKVAVKEGDKGEEEEEKGDIRSRSAGDQRLI